jgi:hypothetical protein
MQATNAPDSLQGEACADRFSKVDEKGGHLTYFRTFMSRITQHGSDMFTVFH